MEHVGEQDLDAPIRVGKKGKARFDLYPAGEVRAEQQQDPRARISAVNPDRFARA
jgi:hypothetical protein